MIEESIKCRGSEDVESSSYAGIRDGLETNSEVAHVIADV